MAQDVLKSGSSDSESTEEKSASYNDSGNGFKVSSNASQVMSKDKKIVEARNVVCDRI